MSEPFRVLVLAGTREARKLCGTLAAVNGIHTTASLAGVVSSPTEYPVPVISGGFGGFRGLASALQRNRINLLVDATHPFAATISENAVKAAELTAVEIAKLERPAWQACGQKDWQEYPSLGEAVRAIPSGSRVFAPLGVGATRADTITLLSERQDVEFVMRLIEPPTTATLPENIVAHIVSRPETEIESEINLLRGHGCTCLLCRNSGGLGGIAKLQAAAAMGLPVHLVARPKPAQVLPEDRIFSNVSVLADWILTLSDNGCGDLTTPQNQQ